MTPEELQKLATQIAKDFRFIRKAGWSMSEDEEIEAEKAAIGLLDQLVAAATQRQAIPAGYWLAPVEADEEMYTASGCMVHHANIYRRQRDSWLARHPEHAAGEAMPQVEPVPGAVWYEGSVSLIPRGREDDYCARKGAKRIYFAASEADASAGRVDGWLPIESAPKDGTRVILAFVDFSAEGYWMDDASRNHWCETGWFYSDDDVLTGHPCKPIAYQHLPTPPSHTGTKGIGA